MSKPVLTYWEGRGRAETIRLMFAAAGIEFEHAPFIVGPDDIARVRASGKLAFNQLPLLQIDGLNLVQSNAMARYVASKGNLLGDGKNAALVDMYVEGCRDFISPFYALGFRPQADFLATIKAQAEKYMPYFETILATQSGPNLVGGKLSMADVTLLEVLLQVEELSKETFAKHPKVTAFLAHTKAVPNIAKYLAGPQRYPANTPEYCATVIKTLQS